MSVLGKNTPTSQKHKQDPHTTTIPHTGLQVERIRKSDSQKHLASPSFRTSAKGCLVLLSPAALDVQMSYDSPPNTTLCQSIQPTRTNVKKVGVPWKGKVLHFPRHLPPYDSAQARAKKPVVSASHMQSSSANLHHLNRRGEPL